MAFLLVLGIFLPLGISLWVAGRIGRLVGDDPHCRRCGFNLRGRDPASTKCSECGTELSPRAIRIGRRERIAGMMWTGVVLTALSSIAVGVGGWVLLRDYDWSPWKPTKWLVEDVDAATGTDYANAVQELKRRVGAPGTSSSTINTILDAAMTRQADRTKKWDHEWSNIIAAAANAHRFDAAHAQKYLENATSATLIARSKIRRNSYANMNLNLKFDRLADNARLMGGWTTSPLMFDSAVFRNEFANQKNEQELAQSVGYGTSFWLANDNLKTIADGKHELKTTVECTLHQTEPFAAGPVTIKLPVVVPVELFPAGAIVDEFKTEPEVREAEHAAFEMTRVTHDAKGQLSVRLKVKDLPRSLAVEIVVTQAAKEQKAGRIIINGGTTSERWVAPYGWEKPKFTGLVDVHLRPSQDAADNEQSVGSFWGEEIVIRNVLVDAPYDPPFNKDESLRPAVEKAIQLPKLVRSPGSKQLGVNVTYNGAPVKLAYKVILSLNGREVFYNNIGPVSAKANSGYGFSCDDVDPDHKATECDVIFRPDPEWETSSQDLVPPWGGEVVFHHVKINTQ